MISNKKVIFIFKQPLSDEWIESLMEVLEMPSIKVAGIIIEKAMHLPFHKFLLRTLKRIRKGHIYLPEYIKNIGFLFLSSFKKSKRACDIFKIAKYKNIPLYQVDNAESEKSLELVKSLDPDIGILYFQRIISEKLFSIPKEGSINIHYGILPQYAGSHTIFWAVANKEKEVGLTVHKFSSIVDQGDILLIKTIPAEGKILNLERKIKELAPKALKETLQGIVEGRISEYKQDSALYEYWKPPTFFERRKYNKYL
jgi:folate-dependent phosphoribosylglycinamide formyltransferase PurN